MAQAKRITVTLDKSTYERVRQAAQARQVSASEILRECARDQLKSIAGAPEASAGTAIELRKWLADFRERITSSGRIISASENIPREELYDRRWRG